MRRLAVPVQKLVQRNLICFSGLLYSSLYSRVEYPSTRLGQAPVPWHKSAAMSGTCIPRLYSWYFKRMIAGPGTARKDITMAYMYMRQGCDLEDFAAGNDLIWESRGQV